MSRTRYTTVLLALLLLPACEVSRRATEASPDSRVEVLSGDQVNWTPLNPARGDASPQAATLWGNRGESVKTGFLVKFRDGFSSPPHTHNVSYRGVVISGEVHNAHPDSEKMYMPAGSFWTQPAGHVHITAAKGANNVAYIEIDDGPYLVLPTEQAFDNGERPINVDATNVVWVDAPESGDSGAKLAYLWKKPGTNGVSGYLLQVPSRFSGRIVCDGEAFRAVVVGGELEHRSSNDSTTNLLGPGSYFSSTGRMVHRVECSTGESCTLYLRVAGDFELENAR